MIIVGNRPNNSMLYRLTDSRRLKLKKKKMCLRTEISNVHFHFISVHLLVIMNKIKFDSRYLCQTLVGFEYMWYKQISIRLFV